MRYRWFLLPLLLWASNAGAAFEQRDLAPRAVAMGGAYTALSDGPGGIFWNPGGIASLRTMTWWNAYCRPFGLDELSSAATVIILPLSPGSWALGLHSYGCSLYRETTALVSCAGPLRPTVRVGATLRALRLNIRNFGSAHTFALDIGFVGRVHSRSDWGMCVWNVGDARMAGETLSRALSMGLAFRPVSDALAAVDVRKEFDAPVQIKVGLEYAATRSLQLRLGVHGRPSSFAFGAGWRIRDVHIDYAARTHLLLGLSHQIAINLMIGSL